MIIIFSENRNGRIWYNLIFNYSANIIRIHTINENKVNSFNFIHNWDFIQPKKMTQISWMITIIEVFIFYFRYKWNCMEYVEDEAKNHFYISFSIILNFIELSIRKFICCDWNDFSFFKKNIFSLFFLFFLFQFILFFL